jgi:hypothetical protein
MKTGYIEDRAGSIVSFLEYPVVFNAIILPKRGWDRIQKEILSIFAVYFKYSTQTGGEYYQWKMMLQTTNGK